MQKFRVLPYVLRGFLILTLVLPSITLVNASAPTAKLPNPGDSDPEPSPRSGKHEPSATPAEYLPYLTPANSHPLLLAAKPDPEPMYGIATELAQPAGPYRTTVRIRGIADLKRLQQLKVAVLAATETRATVLADRLQLAALAKKQFSPSDTELASRLQAHNGLVLAETATAAEILDAITSDNDNDDLNDNEETWWCTDMNNPDSDNDRVRDGDEVQALRNWIGPTRAVRPASGKPFAGWPTNHQPNCYDSDYDSVPDAVEVFEFGLNPNRESTPRDKFDDGQKLFGLTNCPGSGGGCGYGALPRQVDWDGGVIFAEMPSWVKAPYDLPFVAAFPDPEVDVVPSSLVMVARTTIQTDHTIGNGEAHTYGTTETNGSSTSRSDTTTWNTWDEVSIAKPTGASQFWPNFEFQPSSSDQFSDRVRRQFDRTLRSGGELLSEVCDGVFQNACAIGRRTNQFEQELVSLVVEAGYELPVGQYLQAHDIPPDYVKDQLNDIRCSFGREALCLLGRLLPLGDSEITKLGDPKHQTNSNGQGQDIRSVRVDNQDRPQTLSRQRIIPASYPVQNLPIRTDTHGTSRGGAETHTNTKYEEHSTTQSEQFSSSESWSNGTAVNTTQAAELRFTYRITNYGSDYAREISNILFNIYIGDDPLPVVTYDPAPEIGNNGAFTNFMPGETHTYSSNHSGDHPIYLTLDQMRAVDLGAPIFVAVEDYSYGVDELLYQDAVNGGATFIIDSGDGILHNYVLPTWGDETIQDVARRFFPSDVDDANNLLSLSVPDYATQPPTWPEHELSSNRWWNMYLANLGKENIAFKNTSATGGSTVLIRINEDTDQDGYIDRTEVALGKDPNDFSSHPEPQLVAATHSTRVGNVVTTTMAFLNTGTYDAQGIKATMYAPDSTTTIGRNFVGGNGTVRAGSQVVVGSRVLTPTLTSWTGSAIPYSTGSYTGDVDKVFTFTARNPGNVGSQTLLIDWIDSAGITGTLDVGAVYTAPLPITVNSGLKIGFNTGTVNDNDVFAVAVQRPRDTFNYTVDPSGYITPVVVVSYNDPQGNHRFVTPVEVDNLNTDLALYASQMQQGVGIDIITTSPFDAGITNTVYLVANSPHARPISAGHLVVQIVDGQGATVASQMITETFQSGPTVKLVNFNVSSFDPAYSTDEEYKLAAFFTDAQGNIIDSHARFFSTFTLDPKPILNTAPSNSSGWDFGHVVQGDLPQRTISIVNTGLMPLKAVVESPDPTILALTGASGILSVPPAGAREITATLDTTSLTGTVAMSLTVRTNDPANQTVVVPVLGTIVGPAGAANAFDLANKPWDKRVRVYGSPLQNTVVTFTQSIQPDPGSIEPCMIYAEDGVTLKGVGKYCTGFADGSVSYQQLFGGAEDGNFPGGNVDTVKSALSANANAGQPTILVADSSTFVVGKEVMVVQVQGTSAGNYEFGYIVAKGTGSITLDRNLTNSYTQGGSSSAQVLWVPHFGNVSGTVSASEWNGSTGGVAVFRALNLSGTVDLSVRGFKGGYGNNGDNGGQQGNSPSGTGQYNNRSPNGGGGGAGDHCGGCGSHWGSGGGAGYGGTGGNGTGPQWGSGGNLVGSENLSQIFLGSGGGAGAWGSNPYGGGRNTIQGNDFAGQGGGAAVIFARNVSNTNIYANGNAGGNSHSSGGGCNGNPGCGGYAGGGGAGGSIKLIGDVINLGNVTALGGPGGLGTLGNGGVGGVGRIHIGHCQSYSGSISPTPNTERLICYSSEGTGTPLVDQTTFGDGADGPFVVTTTRMMTSTYYTALTSAVVTGATTLNVTNASGFAPDVEVLIHQTQGTGVGTWEMNRLVSVTGNTLNLLQPLAHTYNQGGPNNHTQVVRVPHYTDVIVQSAASLKAPAWNGSTGGLLLFRASGGITITGAIDVSGLGFMGGAGDGGHPDPVQGYQGESQLGQGAASVAHNGGAGGGGRDGFGGGGGGFGASGQPGNSGLDPTRGGQGGNPYGEPLMSKLYLGSGGGGGAHGGGAGNGGNGGGNVLLFGRTIRITGNILARGVAGQGAANLTGGGGGAGGSVKLVGRNVHLGDNMVVADGGLGGSSTYANPGGNGGIGRIRVEYCESYSGTVSNPPTTPVLVPCYTAEGTGTNVIRFTLPADVTNGRNYVFEFGRHYSFPVGGLTAITSTRLISQTYSSVTLQALISNLSAEGSTDFRVAVGGTTLYSATQTITGPMRIELPDAADAINDYIRDQSPNIYIDVPVSVMISRPSDVVLTTLRATPSSGIDLTVDQEDFQIGCPGGPLCLASEGMDVPINITVRNTGYQNAASAVVSYYAGHPSQGGLLLGNSYVPSVPAGGGSVATFDWNTQGFTGTQTLYASVDPSKTIPELDDDNNIISQTLYIRTRPNLGVDAIDPNWTDILEDEVVNTTLMISNTGETLAGGHTARFAMEGLLGDVSSVDLAVGAIPATSTTTLTSTFQPTLFSTHTLTVTLDTANVVNESNETNNVLTRTVFVGLRPDPVDAGTSGDLAYTSTRGYGYLNGSTHDFGGDPMLGTVRFDGSGQVQYQFDGLQPARSYHVDLDFYQEGDTFTQTVLFDDLDSGQTIQMTSEVASTASLLVPYSTYTDRTLIVTIRRPTPGAAFVSRIALIPVEYTYIDAGGPGDVAYDSARGHGYLNNNTYASSLGGTSTLNTYRTAFSNTVSYQFDRLDSDKQYYVNVTMYDGQLSNRQQSVRIGATTPSGCGAGPISEPRHLHCSVPQSEYASDHSIQVDVRCDNCTAPRVNEIAIEENTRGGTAPTPTPTPTLATTPTRTPTGLAQTVVSSFGAQWVGNAVNIGWSTASEYRTDRFELWRSPSLSPASWALIRTEQSHSNCLTFTIPQGYNYTDSAVTPGQTYYYMLSWRGDTCAGLGGTYPNYAIANPATPTPTGTPVINVLIGHVEWQGRPAQPHALQQLPLTLTLRMGTSEVSYAGLTTNANGYFTVPVSGLPNGTYTWRVKGPHGTRDTNTTPGFLANSGSVVLTGASTTSQEMGLMRAGDANNDNLVDVLDFSALKDSFGMSLADPGFDPTADFNGDGTVEVLDFGLLKGSFGQIGDLPFGPQAPQNTQSYGGPNCVTPAEPST